MDEYLILKLMLFTLCWQWIWKNISKKVLSQDNMLYKHWFEINKPYRFMRLAPIRHGFIGALRKWKKKWQPKWSGFRKWYHKEKLCFGISLPTTFVRGCKCNMVICQRYKFFSNFYFSVLIHLVLSNKEWRSKGLTYFTSKQN